jgi:hypothetical protein
VFAAGGVWMDMGRFEHRQSPLASHGAAVSIGVGDQNPERALAKSGRN